MCVCAVHGNGPNDFDICCRPSLAFDFPKGKTPPSVGPRLLMHSADKVGRERERAKKKCVRIRSFVCVGVFGVRLSAHSLFTCNIH